MRLHRYVLGYVDRPTNDGRLITGHVTCGDDLLVHVATAAVLEGRVRIRQTPAGVILGVTPIELGPDDALSLGLAHGSPQVNHDGLYEVRDPEIVALQLINRRGWVWLPR